MHPEQPNAESRTFVYHAKLPPLAALLLVAPVLVLFLSFAAAVLTGGALAALASPLLGRRRRARSTDRDCIVLEPDQYARVDERPRLPPQ